MFPILIATAAIASGQAFAPDETDYQIHDYRFASGEMLPELNLHATTIGRPAKDANGRTIKAVLIMHGTGGTGRQFLTPIFANVLFKRGGLLDAEKYYIILPDAIGHGRSTKPSNGLHAKFPHYGYHDIVNLQYRLITEHLGVNHLRLVMGTSMGGMQTWIWGETYPDFMDALMPLASLPVQIAGRNRMTRRMIIDDISQDPTWENGEYKTQPHGLGAALDILTIMGSSAQQMMKRAPTRDEADAMLERSRAASLKTTDANDLLYQVSASFDYDPQSDLEKIQAPLIAINSADDFINPPELGILEREVKRVKKGKCVVIPI
ncbi:MAG TPA: alpha/beta fold hydrolase [Fimbriimonas sp.]|nr:alpha/beta fold hydrolase [Fimbriimonas sp.]